MKRRLNNFFQLLSKGIGILILAIVFIPVGIFFSLGSARCLEIPTHADYAKLYEQEEMLKEDFKNIYLIEGAFLEIIQNSNIKVTLISETNSDCKLQIIFDENKEWISTEEICVNLNISKNSITGDYEITTQSMILIIISGVSTGVVLSIGIQTLYAFICNKLKNE